MALLVEQFIQNACESMLLSIDEIASVRSELPESQQQETHALATALVRSGKLTVFQARSINAGRTKLVLGQYAILEKIGVGGMGNVYLARHRTMDREVALKTLLPKAMESPDAVKRFHQEVRAAARLMHPNIVAAYDAGEDRGTHYLVMEYVEGSNLSDLIANRGPLNPGEAANCIAQAARGLQYAHEQGVVHRDIKLSNLLLSKEGIVKILDMGLARLERETIAASGGLTQTGQVIGTVDYMAPEQAMNMKDADERSDIYSLGCSLYVLLTGDNVFDGETLLNKMMAHRNHAIPSLASLGKEYGHLDVIFRKMVAKSPVDRYQNMGEVIHDLQLFIAGEGDFDVRALGVSSRPNFTDTNAPTVDVGESAAAFAEQPTTIASGTPATLHAMEPTQGFSESSTSPLSTANAIHLVTEPRENTKRRQGTRRRSRGRSLHLMLGLLGLGSLMLIGGTIALIVNAKRGGSSDPPAADAESADAAAADAVTADGTSKPDAATAVTGRSANLTPLTVARNAVPVFILAGQTNMTGAGSVPQLKSLTENPETRPKYAELLDKDGDFRVRNDVWLVTPEGASPLTVGLGNTTESFGPALMIGNRLGDRYGKPVVLVRFTYGPWSLAEEGRPPSSGPPVGQTYEDFVSFVSEVRADLGKFCPACKGMKADIQGFFWLQGWNDLVNPKRRSEYQTNLPNFFRDFRSQLQQPSLPIVLGELGQSGILPEGKDTDASIIREAQQKTAETLADTVLVKTSTMVHPEDAPGKPFLYGQDARTFVEIGEAFGNAMIHLLERKSDG